MKKLLAFLLSVAICISLLTVPVSAASADEATLAAATLSMMGAIQGDGSGSLGLSNTLTRAQFCKIAVVVMGLSNKVSQYAGYTIFPDVPSTSWAAGYVNLAVRYAGILTGYANGYFGPNDLITYGQAVTILMKMLGYTTDDVGAKWPDGFIEKAEEIGLTQGVSLTGSSNLTKGNMAVLFLNLLNTKLNGSEITYMETISGVSVASGVFLVSSSAETDDGVSGAVQIAGAQSGTYLPVGSVPDTLIGAYGTLVINSAGKALTFVPSTSGSTVTSTVLSAAATSIKCSDGTKITMSSSTAFYLNGETVSYGSAWTNINGGMLVSAHYNDSGTLQCVLVTSADWGSSSAFVVTTDSYALPASVTVTINGNPAAVSDIMQYDVVTDNGSGVYSVSRRKITARLEEADPSADLAETVTLLGTEFDVLDSAVDDLAGVSIGDTITLLLTSGNKVAGVITGSSQQNTNYGVVTNLSSSSATVQLSNGISVTGSLLDSSTDIYKGSFVKVGSSKTGYIDLYPVTSSTAAATLDVAAGTLGTVPVSKSLVVYECVGSGSVCEIALSDIAAATVGTSKISFVAYDASNRAYLILLNDVTGDRYTYGFIANGTGTETTDNKTATYNTTSVTNGNGTITARGGAGFTYGDIAGIAASLDGMLAGAATLTAVSGVGRQDFELQTDGSYVVTTGSGVIPVSDEVQVYVTKSGTWTTLAKGRAYSDDFTVYYDKTIETGGKVRVVVVN